MSDLEEAFVRELRLFSDLYGHTTFDQAKWATGCLPFDCVAPYMQAWTHGRRLGWRNLTRLAERIKVAADVEGESWLFHLKHLEALAGVDAAALGPTTQAAHL